MSKLKLPEGEGAVKPGGRDPQILGDRGVELQGLSIYGMLEGQVLGVQPEPTAGGRATVERVSVHRMSDGREVDPDLVRPPRAPCRGGTRAWPTSCRRAWSTPAHLWPAPSGPKCRGRAGGRRRGAMDRHLRKSPCSGARLPVCLMGCPRRDVPRALRACPRPGCARPRRLWGRGSPQARVPPREPAP